MKKRILKSMFMSIALLTVGILGAQDTNKKGDKFRLIDANNDELISRTELRIFTINKFNEREKKFSEEKFEKRFAKADLDKDGFLTKSEMKLVKKKRKKRKAKKGEIG